MKWIRFEDKEPEFQSDILMYDGTNIVSHEPIYTSFDCYDDWDPKPKYWLYVEDLINEIDQPERLNPEASKEDAIV